MPTYVSPGTYVVETDNSEYPVSVNPSVVGIVGFAEQGPLDKPTLVTSQENLINLFGEPSETIPGQGLEGSIEILEATNSLYFVRAADDSATDASASITVGACPAVNVSGLDFGITSSLTLRLTLSSTAGQIAQKTYSIPAGTLPTGADQAAALKKVIGGSVDGSIFGVGYDLTDADVSSGAIFGGYAGSGFTLKVEATSSTTFDESKGVSALKPYDLNGDPSGVLASSVEVKGATLLAGTETSGFGYLVESLYPGAGYNLGTKEDGSTSGYSFEVQRTGGVANSVQVNRNGFSVESYRGSFTAEGGFWEGLINQGVDNATSQYIKANFYLSGAAVDANFGDNFTDSLSTFVTGTVSGTGLADDAAGTANGARFIKFVEGTYGLAGGDSGIPTTADDIADTIIGGAAEKKGIYALDDDTLNISMGLTPGLTNQNIQNNLISLAETSQNFLAVVAPPEGLNTPQEAIDWHNGQSNERTAAITSNFAAIYWPWVEVFDQFAGKDRYYDPAVWAVRQMCVTDDVADPWFAPAGVIRGRLTKPTDVEVSVNQGDRDSMYSGGNVINPIVKFPQQGIMIFGQRTAQRTGSALDRVNVRRMLIIVRKQVLAATRRYVFEPNDATTWEKVQKTLELLLDELKRRRGLVDYKVVCDETTNTPLRVDRNELWAKCILKPTKAAEIVVVELDLRSQSAEL